MDWLLWQLADSAFPAGGFAHSNGLESACQHGQVTDGPSLTQFLAAGLAQTAHGPLPLLLAVAQSPARFAELDARCDLFLNNHVANRASRAQGRAILSAVGRIFAPPALGELEAQVRRQRLPAHLPPTFGAIAAALGFGAGRAAELFTFLTLRGWVSAAVRLGIVGPMEGQSIQASLGPAAAAAVARSLEVPVQQISQTTIFLDMLHANHDRLYSRLFQS